ncbi:excisionase family DNA-binding protein [Micromonospora purpureochromogenes]|uniref:excisionase family DNA-binding protein n=1 Tax=Micromonospora purpureochromogenes TaxID=47872 RepID=UPI0033D6B3F4
MERLLTVKEAATRLGTTERFPRRLIAERRIRYVKLGGHHVRIPEAALARKNVGLDDLTFHDLRHTGQTLAAQTGATLADLMKRLGHSSMAAARRYLHAVDGRDREIAKALSELAAHGDVARLPRHITMRS